MLHLVRGAHCTPVPSALLPPLSSATNRIIIATDHASVQFNIGNLNQHGVYNGTSEAVAFSGMQCVQLSALDFDLRSGQQHRGVAAHLPRFVPFAPSPLID